MKGIKIAAKISTLVLVLVLGCFPAFAAATFTPLTGISVQADNSKSWGVGTESSISAGTITCKAIGATSSKKNNIIITNTSSEEIIIKFDYSISSASSYSGFSSTSGTHKLTLAAGGSAEFSISSGTWNTATLTMSNFQTVIASATITVSATHSTTYGTVTMDDASIANWNYKGTDVTVTDAGATFKATAVTTTNSNMHFVAWIDPDTNQILSLSASYTLVPTTESMKIKAVFSYTTAAAYFQVGDYLYQGLDVAVTQAQAGKGTTIILRSNGSLLKNQNYEVPTGYTLLIPFDVNGTLYTTEPASTSSTTSPSAYKTLYIRAGATLTVNGAMSVSAKHHYGKGNVALGCAPVGKYGRVNMTSGSSIVVNGSLYTWGYIYGSGTVTANSGAVVYELLQLEDFRGGSQTVGMQNEVFPFSQYYVQNVQVPLTLCHGAKEYAYVSLYMSGSAIGKTIDFIGNSNCMFTTTEGSTATKTYDGTTDRLIITFDGNGSVESIGFDFGMLYSFNSADYVMPLNSNLTVVINSGTVTINQDIALLPGARIEIAEGAEIKIGSGKNIYVYDQDEWGNYCFATTVTEETYLTKTRNQPLDIARYAVSRSYTRTVDDLIDAAILINGTLDVSEGYIYTTTGGANIYSTNNGKIIVNVGSETSTYQFIQGYSVSNDNDEVLYTQDDEYVAIAINSAWLTNSDGSYVKTAESGTGTYNYTDGFWLLKMTTQNVTTGARYQTLTAAITAATSGDYLQMLAATEETIDTSGKTLYLDLAGNTVTASSVSGTIYGMDSSTDAFTETEMGKLVVTNGDTSAIQTLTKYELNGITPKYYVAAISAGKTVSFPRVASAVTGIQYIINPNDADYLIFEGTFRGSSTAASMLKDMGFKVGGTTPTWFNKADDKNALVPADGATVYFGTTFNDEAGTTVQSMLGFGSYEDSNANGYSNTAPSLVITIPAGIADNAPTIN